MIKKLGLLKIFIIITLLLSFLFGASSAQAARATKIGLILLPEDSESNAWYNALSTSGFYSAANAYSLTGTLYPTTNYDEIEAAIRQCAIDGNNLCIGTGFTMESAIVNAANEFPSTKFMLNDLYRSSGYVIPSNLRIVVYDVRQAGYLAGVLSAKMTSTYSLGVIGGMDIPPVNEFITGYQNAVSCYGPQSQVQVVYAGDFGNPDLGTILAQELMTAGADIIYPVAGGTGDGALTFATQNGAWAIGVDIDQYYTVFDGGTVPGADRLLTSTIKNIDKGVYYMVSDLARNRFTGGYKVYGLKQGGVGLAPYHDSGTFIPLDVQKLVEKVKLDIIKGRINTYYPCW